MKKYMFYLFLVVIFLVFCIAIRIKMNPLRKSCAEIKNDLLETIHLGTNLNQVVDAIEKNDKWLITDIWYDDGHSQMEKGNMLHYGNTAENAYLIRVNLGSYRNFFITDVIAFFRFKNSKLIEIEIKKYTDSF